MEYYQHKISSSRFRRLCERQHSFLDMNMKNSFRHYASAFTLIELLVVIAIIGILAALLLSVLSTAKDRSRRIECLGNLKQLQNGWQLYLGDHNDAMPPNHWDGVGGQNAGSAPGSWVVGNARELSPTNIQLGVQWRYNPQFPRGGSKRHRPECQPEQATRRPAQKNFHRACLRL